MQDMQRRAGHLKKVTIMWVVMHGKYKRSIRREEKSNMLSACQIEHLFYMKQLKKEHRGNRI